MSKEEAAEVLSLDPSNKYTRFNLAVLEQNAGYIDKAISLYQEALRQDPNFAPAEHNMEFIMRTHYGLANPHPR